MRTGPVISISWGLFITTQLKINNMPYKTVYVEPEIFLYHNGVTVVHTYKYNDIESTRSTNYFSLAEWEEEVEFDVRKFKNFDHTKKLEYANGQYLDYFAEVMTLAIESGEMEEISNQLNQPYECD
jgi:hypothetical protein